MARHCRVQFAGANYHVFTRGNDRRGTYADDRDRQTFLGMVDEAIARFKADLLAYCLMPNHFHLLLRTNRPNLSRCMHWLISTYSGWLNHRHGRTGHVYGGRYKSLIVDSDRYLLNASRYIHLNPHDLGMDFRSYRWSSMPEYLGTVVPGRCERATILAKFEQPHDYLRFAEEKLGVPDEEYWAQVKAGFVLGDEEFLEKIKARAGSLSQDVSRRRELLAVPAERILMKLDSEPDSIRFYALWKWGMLTHRQIGELVQKKADAVRKAMDKIRKQPGARAIVDARLTSLLSASPKPAGTPPAMATAQGELALSQREDDAIPLSGADPTRKPCVRR